MAFQPHIRLTGFGSRSFSVTAPSFGTLFPWTFETVLPYPVFATNLKPSFTKQLFGLLSAPSHPQPNAYLLTYLLTYVIAAVSLSGILAYKIMKECRKLNGVTRCQFVRAVNLLYQFVLVKRSVLFRMRDLVALTQYKLFAFNICCSTRQKAFF